MTILRLFFYAWKSSIIINFRLMYEIEKLLMQTKALLQDSLDEYNKKILSENMSDWFDIDLWTRIEHLKFMIARLEEFKQSEIDWLEKNQYDNLI